jgi:hypothetical protein
MLSSQRLARVLTLCVPAAFVPLAVDAQQPPPVSLVIVTCVSENDARLHCPADTSGGVALAHSTGTAICLPGRNWGYDNDGIWVTEGCGGDFVLGESTRTPKPAPTPTPTPAPEVAPAPEAPPGVTPPLVAERPTQPGFLPPPEPDQPSSYGVLDASSGGFLIGRSKVAELSLSAYALVRAIDQQPAGQSFTDHLGNVRSVDARRDVQFHRAMLHFKGWIGSPKFRYQITSWSVMSTNQTTLYGFLGYRFHKHFNLYAGINSIGGSRSLMGSSPFWLGHDRVMADEFFRPGFTGSIWMNGEVVPGLMYNLSLGNNLSQLGLNAKQLTRDIATGGSIWWMPTTHEFGPNGSYGDFDYHEQLATRFGISTGQSREDRFNQNQNSSPDNTQVRLADSVLLFETGSLASGVTVQKADFRVLSVDAGFKYRGIFVQAEYYKRRLDRFIADGPLPVASILDDGFYVQSAFYPIPRKLELYAATSWVLGDKDAGFETSHEYLGGMNFYPYDSRNYRLNLQVISVDRSPASSLFGYYVGGQKGTTFSAAASIYF